MRSARRAIARTLGSRIWNTCPGLIRLGFFPMTVLIHRAAYDPRPKVRTGTWVLLAVAGLLLLLSLPVFPNELQAYGNNLAATVLLVGGLVWHILNPPLADDAHALPPATGHAKT